MVNDFENTLRTLILLFLSNEPDNYKISNERIEKWIEKRNLETKKKKGVNSENRLIYYSDFYDIETIINKNWNIFKEVFIDKKRFDVFFKEVSNYRNIIAHGRSLHRSQELLLEGILLDFKTLITVYHNKNKMVDDYYISILKISDNLGNIWSRTEAPNSKILLREGDFYEIEIEAFDPKNRDIEYTISTLSSELHIIQKNGKFNFVVSSRMIKKSITVYCKVSTPHSDYENSEMRTIVLSVLPK